jgi:hypothetical protein
VAVSLQGGGDVVMRLLGWEAEPLRVEAAGREVFVDVHADRGEGWPKSREYVGK